MKKSGKALKPGWGITEGQHSKLWFDWTKACEGQGWDRLPTAEREAKRREVLSSLGFESAKDIDRKKGFDRVIREFQRLAGIINITDGDEVRLLHSIGERIPVLMELTNEDYVATLLKQRFKIVNGVRDFTDLSAKEKVNLLRTVNSRISTLSSQPVAV